MIGTEKITQGVDRVSRGMFSSLSHNTRTQGAALSVGTENIFFNPAGN